MNVWGPGFGREVSGYHAGRKERETWDMGHGSVSEGPGSKDFIEIVRRYFSTGPLGRSVFYPPPILTLPQHPT